MKRLILFLATVVALTSTVFAQAPSTIRGTVTFDEDGAPLPGVSVFVQGTQTGAVTDLNGNYVINNVPSSARVLVFSFIGMETLELPVAAVVNAVLSSDSEALQEAVVTIAYGAAKRSTLTGAIASVDAEKIVNRPTSSVASALEGSVSGVQVNSTYGSPGDDPSIRIRGIGTINGSASPLYVLDGVPYSGNISDLNPADIESMTVLKDAASAALYGNRASNGVILITTKKGIQGRLSVSLDIKQGTYTRGIKEYETVTPQEFMEVSWQNMYNNLVYADNPTDPGKAAEIVNKTLVEDRLGINIFNVPDDQLFTGTNGKFNPNAQILAPYAEDLDWYSLAIRRGYRQEYNLNASGATNDSDYYFSVGYLDENGYVTNSGFKRLTARASVNVRPVSWFKTGLNVFGSHQNYMNTNGDSSGSYTNAFMYCRQIAPIYPVHLHDIFTGEYILDANGNKQYDSGQYIDANGAVQSTRTQYPDRHVIWENELNSDDTVRNTLQGTLYADIYFLKDFTFTLTGDLNVRNNENFTYGSAVIGDSKGNLGRAKRVDYRYKRWSFQQQLRWSHQFGDHGVSALLGHENYYFNRDYLYGYKGTEVFPGSPNMSNFTNIMSLDGYQDNDRTESYLGRVRYNYMDKYNLEASFRRDGSSHFSRNFRWGNFWSVGANWMISREPFMQAVPWVNTLKLRADFGQVGNDSGSGYYGYMALYEAETHANKGAYYVTQLPNEELKWETGESWGVGIESRLFNRLNFNIEYFDRVNKDLLFSVPLPLSAGATTTSGSPTAAVTKNIGSIANRGIEVEMDVDVVRTRDFRFNVGANATLLRNKVLSLPEEVKTNKGGFIDGNKKIMEGHDRYAFYTYTFVGVDQMTGRSLYKFNDEDFFIAELDDKGNPVTDANGNYKILFGSEKNSDGEPNSMATAGNYVIINGKPYALNTSNALREWHGSSIPKVYGGFNFDFGYKNLSLSAVFTYSLGAVMMDGVYSNLMDVGSTVPHNYHKDIMNSWMGVPAGMTETSPDRIDPNGIPEINSNDSNYNNATSSRWLVSADYLIFKNLAITYQFPRAFAQKLTLSGISLSASCENLFTLTARQGMNPQQSYSGSQSNYLVTPRVFTASLKLNF
ncbi:MAG: SusC/RagA family TonB-linked outer membrane protein [Bacteroidales bacterium]|nr:SusC/RagA family TonB-linked outer membrane protein [Bacteroidales bacterium]